MFFGFVIGSLGLSCFLVGLWIIFSYEWGFDGDTAIFFGKFIALAGFLIGGGLGALSPLWLEADHDWRVP